MKLYKALQNKYNFSDYQIKLLHYFLLSFFSESSKIILIGLYFYWRSQMPSYLWGLLIFFILRYLSGGFHCKTYIGCFCFTFLFFNAVIFLFPLIKLSVLLMLLFLLLGILLAYFIAPVHSQFRPELPLKKKQKYRIELFSFIFFYSILVFIYPNNPYIIIGFWIIIIQMLLLTFTFIARR